MKTIMYISLVLNLIFAPFAYKYVKVSNRIKNIEIELNNSLKFRDDVVVYLNNVDSEMKRHRLNALSAIDRNVYVGEVLGGGY